MIHLMAPFRCVTTRMLIRKTVAITSSYSGADVSNYSVTNQSSTTANITTKALTVSGITASSKTYDGGTSATLNTSSVAYSGLLMAIHS